MNKPIQKSYGTLILDQTVSCYEKFMELELIQTKSRVIGKEALEDFTLFSDNSKRLIRKLANFVESESTEVSFLVLGRIQSGKTAHLLSTLAWAADSDINTAIVFTGITGPLNTQTLKRIEKEFEKLGQNFVTVLKVPTKSQKADYELVKSKLIKYIAWRKKEKNFNGAKPPLPVLVSMKNPPRIESLKTLLQEVANEFGDETLCLFIDDEADQASQNAGAYNSTTTRTYREISNLRDIKMRNILLSYTATPQAVLHAPRRGRLRPDFCVRVEPRFGYFGLREITSPAYELNVNEINDWQVSTLRSKQCPKSLTNAIFEFYWTYWIRLNLPSNFYNNSELSPIIFDQQMKSCQMLIHQSVRTNDHKKIHEMVLEQINGLFDSLRDVLTDEISATALKDLNSKLQGAGKKVFDRLGVDFPFSNLNKELIDDFFNIVEDTKIFVLNGSQDRPGTDEDLPSGNSDKDGWDGKPWILIGGDMLGRGLTIPQLVSTYFLRMANRPNFDTVSQQMRFCGYRKSYSRACAIYAPSPILKSFRRMQAIDSIMWNRAGQWDLENVDLKKTDLTIIYASTSNSMDPTRKAVRDPNLYDVKYSSENIFSPKKIFQPILFRNNLRNVNSWMEENSVPFDKISSKNSGNFRIYKDIDNFQFLKLLSMIDVEKDFEGEKLAALELFNAEEENYGLNYLPKYVIINESIPSLRLSNFTDLKQIVKSCIGRSVEKKQGTLEKWFNDYNKINIKLNFWPGLSTPHIGDGQRSLYSSIGFDAALMVIEPIKGWIKGHEDAPFALGLATSVIVPKSYQIRTIGFR
jgi:hypothetical protein